MFINGPVGAGKSTVAEEVSALEGAAGGVHALIDVDAVRGLRPSPAGDPFQHELELRNLGDLARNFRAAGAVRLILAGVIERADELPRYRAALGTDALLVVRLAVRPEVAVARLTARHRGAEAELRWHLARTVELARILGRAGVDDLVLDASDESPGALAARVRAAAGWAP